MFWRKVKKFESQRITDPVFGTLVSDAPDSWIGRVLFHPLGKELDLSIHVASEDLPGVEHRRFYLAVIEQWPAIYESLRPKLLSTLKSINPELSEDQLLNSFNFQYLELRSVTGNESNWEIGATTHLDDHLFGLEMKGFKLINLRMDG